MLEALLTTGSGGMHYPDSGPGNKTLIAGVAGLGYFGEVSSALLFSSMEIGSAAQLTFGTDTGNGSLGPNWLKFLYKGKFLFIAKTPIRYGVSWNDLYNLGLVYGERGFGRYPVGAGVTQYVQLHKREDDRVWFFKPRLLTGWGTDPVVEPFDMTQRDDSEYSQLLGRVVTGANGSIVNKWAAFTPTQLSGTGQLASLTQETWATNLAAAISRGYTTIADYTTMGKDGRANTRGSNWRPVLELIPDDFMKDLYDHANTCVGNIPPVIVDRRAPEVGILSPVNVYGTADLGLTAFALTGAPANMVGNPINLVNSVADLYPFAVSGENIA